MIPDNLANRAALDALAGRLVAETGISPAQANELIGFLGANWSSLVREARLIPKPRVV
jgi:hypothetical protein